MKVVLVGGHLSPALAVIQELGKNNIFYVGRKYTFEGEEAQSLEYTEIKKMGIPFFEINAARLQRKFSRHTVPSLLKFPVGFFQGFKILKTIKPEVVLGFGGYLSVPVVLSARILNIPVVLHEQTLEAGFANKILSNFAQKVCISWESSRKYFPKEKTVLTGNPVKRETIDVVQSSKKELPLVYITGGSSGSHAVNLLVEKTLEKLLQKCRVVHQTGESQKYKDFERLENKIKESKIPEIKNYKIKKFLSPEEASKALSDATLVVGRSGINTVTELIFLEKPAFLIPLPFAQKNEQLKNAEFLKNLGLGEFLEQDKITAELFISTIFSMIAKINKYKLKEKVLITDASKKIVKVLEDVSKKKAD